MESGEINPQDYVFNADWNIGYFWGGGSLLGGAFWQPMKLHESETARYIIMLLCRTSYRSSGYLPNINRCMTCELEHCPLSSMDLKREGASWKNENPERDYRLDLFMAAIAKVERELGIPRKNLTGFISHNGEYISLGAVKCGKNIHMSLPVTILNDVLYDPRERNWDEILAEMGYQLYVIAGRGERLIITPGSEGEPMQKAREFWASHGCDSVYESDKDTSASECTASENEAGTANECIAAETDESTDSGCAEEVEVSSDKKEHEGDKNITLKERAVSFIKALSGKFSK